MSVSDTPWKHAFHSGMSSSDDLRAATDLGLPVGVVAPLLTTRQIFLTLPKHLDAGGKLFVDSGAFSAFQKRTSMDWEKVFQTYETLINQTVQTGNLSIVAPDVVGDQASTLDLWAEHAQRVKRWIDAGSRVIVPLQVGRLSAGDLLEEAFKLFGTRKLCAGVPSNLAAMTANDAATIRHGDFHILGRVVLTPELAEKLSAILQSNPDAQLTADANWLRARTARISSLASALPRSNVPFDCRRSRAIKELLVVDGYHQQAHRFSSAPLTRPACTS